MSSTSKWRIVCESERSIPLNPNDFCSNQHKRLENPIDDFYAYLQALMQLGTSQQLKSSDEYGRVLLLGVVSATEQYFRSILAALLNECRHCRDTASSETISFGAIDYYSKEDIGLGLLEHTSMASSRDIKSSTKKLTGFDIKPGSSIDTAISHFGELCHFRHAAVHSRGELAQHNARELKIKASGARVALVIRQTQLHEAGAICNNVVRAYNRFLYQEVVGRWIKNGDLIGQWKHDKQKFSSIFRLFASRTDGVGPTNAYQAHRSLSAAIQGNSSVHL